MAQTETATAAGAGAKRHRFNKGNRGSNNNSNNNTKEGTKEAIPGRGALTKEEYETLKRRNRRAKSRARKMVCFHCRNTGHSVQECPRLNTEKTADGAVVPGPQASGICYRCGSLEHTLAKCPKPKTKDGSLPFAECYVCKGRGHLASMCDQNENGLYPQGGHCKHCGSVRHLAKDCEQNPRYGGVGSQPEVFAVASTGLERGDDDQPLLQVVDEYDSDGNEVRQPKKLKRKDTGLAAAARSSTTNTASAATLEDVICEKTSAPVKRAAPAKRKVVRF